MPARRVPPPRLIDIEDGMSKRGQNDRTCSVPLFGGAESLTSLQDWVAESRTDSNHPTLARANATPPYRSSSCPISWVSGHGGEGRPFPGVVPGNPHSMKPSQGFILSPALRADFAVSGVFQA